MNTRQPGTSLIELLVILAVVGAVLGAISLSLGSRPERLLETSARRAEALVRLACERAVLTGVDIGWRFEVRGWRFGYLRRDGWEPVANDAGDELRPRNWETGMAFELRRDDLLIDPAAEPLQPQLLCLASGEMTPFALQLSHSGAQTRWQLSGEADGSLLLEPVVPPGG